MTIVELPLLAYQERIKQRRVNGQSELFCLVRKKWLHLTPEELVRQLLLLHLIEIGYSSNRIRLEQKISIPNSTSFYRADIVVYDQQLRPQILIECKSAIEQINENVLRQISRYNRLLQVSYLVVSNGPKTIICQLNFAQKTLFYLDNIPDPATLTSAE